MGSFLNWGPPTHWSTKNDSCWWSGVDDVDVSQTFELCGTTSFGRVSAPNRLRPCPACGHRTWTLEPCCWSDPNHEICRGRWMEQHETLPFSHCLWSAKGHQFTQRRRTVLLLVSTMRFPRVFSGRLTCIWISVCGTEQGVDSIKNSWQPCPKRPMTHASMCKECSKLFWANSYSHVGVSGGIWREIASSWENDD